MEWIPNQIVRLRLTNVAAASARAAADAGSGTTARPVGKTSVVPLLVSTNRYLPELSANNC